MEGPIRRVIRTLVLVVLLCGGMALALYSLGESEWYALLGAPLVLFRRTFVMLVRIPATWVITALVLVWLTPAMRDRLQYWYALPFKWIADGAERGLVALKAAGRFSLRVPIVIWAVAVTLLLLILVAVAVALSGTGLLFLALVSLRVVMLFSTKKVLGFALFDFLAKVIMKSSLRQLSPTVWNVLPASVQAWMSRRYRRLWWWTMRRAIRNRRRMEREAARRLGRRTAEARAAAAE